MAKLQRSVLVLLFLFLIFAGMYFAKEFLVPIVISGVFAMLFIGISNYLESKGINRALSALISVFILLASVSVILILLSMQLSEFAGKVDMMKQRIGIILVDLKRWVHQTVGLSMKQQDELLKQQQTSGGVEGGSMVATIASSAMGVLVNAVLGVVYMYLFLFYRSHIKKFILKLVPDSELKNTEDIVHQSGDVARKYLSGLSLMIVMLWIMYGIGFSIVGVENAIFFAILCGVLEIVPFVGNITGTSLTVLAVLVQGGDGGMVVGVLSTYFVIQFVQTYILEPLVVGEQVSINPLFTIMAIVLGEMVWGVPGMILAIPLIGIVKIICDNVPDLKPYGFLIGSQSRKQNTGVIDKLKGFFSKK
ncbi:AI-2E family transporter [Mucilaginibacter limnophilus]|uniref:AI-2E family transporter n=1 Tax=Mucilaginibacter limnophilus TaxID=1932778 RepID=A0A437MZF1_9SPHI|nr:AI-2E family transporter [Mucilaginibacter limnophilus]RVU03061.1 AI-2E family transporter [Mucilaginibacter limnophilus]